MNYLKKLSQSIGISIIVYISLLIVITFLSYFNIINGKFLTILKLLVLFLSLFSGAYIFGKKATKRGWLEGLKFGLITLILLFILNFIFYKAFTLKNFIYYLILLLSSILGSMFGILKKRK